MKNKYYHCEFNLDGEVVRRNMKIEMDTHYEIQKIMGKSDKQIIEEIWGLPIKTIKKSSKFNYLNGQF